MAFLDFLPIIGGAAQALWQSTVGQSQSKDLMRYQAELNQQAVNAQNRYNSPIAQMERLRDAGLNPNLVYGNGVEGNQSSSPNVGISARPAAPDFGFAESVNNIFKRQQLGNETMIAEANRDKILADEMLSTARYLSTMQDVARKDATFDVYVDTAAARLENLRQQTSTNKAREDLLIQQNNNAKIVANNLVLQGEKLAAETSLTEEKALTEVVKREALRAGIRLKDAQAHQIAEMLPYIKLGTGLRALEYEVKELEFLSSDELNRWLEEHPNVEMGVEVVDAIIDRISRITSGVRFKPTRRRGGKRRK